MDAPVTRRAARKVWIDRVPVGGDAPIMVQGRHWGGLRLAVKP